MTRYIAFLRAINVAGHAVVKMTDVSRAFVAAGCSDVKTVIQSGNVLFDLDGKEDDAFRRILVKLEGLIGSEPIVMFRTLREVQSLLKDDPFRELQPDPLVKLYVAFLAERPSRKPKLPLVLAKEGLEAFRVAGREAFIVSRRKENGMFGFPNNFVEKELGVAATTRNWSTVRRIAGLSVGGPARCEEAAERCTALNWTVGPTLIKKAVLAKGKGTT
jgi:uncharacterized protein (DUF1697 family)